MFYACRTFVGVLTGCSLWVFSVVYPPTPQKKTTSFLGLFLRLPKPKKNGICLLCRAALPFGDLTFGAQVAVPGGCGTFFLESLRLRPVGVIQCVFVFLREYVLLKDSSELEFHGCFFLFFSVYFLKGLKLCFCF